MKRIETFRAAVRNFRQAAQGMFSPNLSYRQRDEIYEIVAPLAEAIYIMNKGMQAYQAMGCRPWLVGRGGPAFRNRQYLAFLDACVLTGLMDSKTAAEALAQKNIFA